MYTYNYSVHLPECHSVSEVEGSDQIAQAELLLLLKHQGSDTIVLPAVQELVHTGIVHQRYHLVRHLVSNELGHPLHTAAQMLLVQVVLAVQQ